MKNYNDLHYYRGDVYERDSSSSDRLVEQGTLLQYNGYDNKFLWESKGTIYLAKYFCYSIENNEEKKEECKKEMDRYILSTDIPSDDGIFYVKEDTLVEQKRMSNNDYGLGLVKKYDEQHGINVQYGKKK